MREFEPAHLMELTSRIYQAGLDPSLWDGVLDMLEGFYQGSRITLFGHQAGRPTETLALHRNYPADDLRAYVEHHVRSSPHVARAHRIPVGRAVYSESVIQDREFHATEHYNEYVRPRGLGYHAVGLVLDRNPGGMIALSMADHKNDQDRRGRQIRLLDSLAPHLLRSMRLHARISAERVKAQAAHAAFARWAHAAFVLSAAGEVVLMNSAAEKLIARDDGLSLGRNGRLMGADSAITQLIEDVARRCARMALSVESRLDAAEIGGVALPRSSGAPLRAMFWPLSVMDGAVSAAFARGAALTLVIDPDRARRPPIGWLAKQYGLSPGERRLTEAIVNGAPLADAAEQLGIRLSTARTRLKIIQTKTQCHRQVDLVRLALSLPEIRDDES